MLLTAVEGFYWYKEILSLQGPQERRIPSIKKVQTGNRNNFTKLTFIFTYYDKA